MNPRAPEEFAFREQRLQALRASRSVNALLRVDALAEPRDGPVWGLRLHFLSAPPDGLAPGSVRIRNPAGEVDPGFQVTRIAHPPDARDAIDVFVRVAEPRRAARLRSDPAQYRLEVDAPGLDRFFRGAAVRFDGRPPSAAPAGERARDLPDAADIDYLAKDYASFRQVMLERMAAHVPQWSERNPADIGVAIVEVLAYAADYLSYYQDAVATEAYLDTARRRSSVRRHLRLVGHVLHEGCNARAWVEFRVDGARALELPAGTALLTRAGDLPAVLHEGSAQLAAALDQGSVTFETMHPVRLSPRLNAMPVHAWGAHEYTLPRGATSAALVGHLDELAAGDVLILEREHDGDADACLPHVLRLSGTPRLTTDPLGAVPITEIEFFEEDALPDAVSVARGGGGRAHGALVARGNVVLADHGRGVREALPAVRDGERYRPALTSTSVTWHEPFDAAQARTRAAAAVSQRPQRALPAITLHEVVGDDDEPVGETWRARRDLLESPPFAAEFVAETEEDGSVRLRFGDGRQGRRPAPGTRFVAAHRVGDGAQGHIGSDALAHVVGDGELAIAALRNPLPAQGGEAREPLEKARLVAPRAFRETANCVTAADLARLARSHPEVLHAAAEARWTGSWNTLYLFVQRPSGAAVTPAFEARLREFLEPALLAGSDLEICAPIPLALEIRLRGVVEPRAAAHAVRAALVERLAGADDGAGRRGYFHCDRFGFGQPVHLDGVLDEAMKCAGIVSIDADVFRPWGSAPGADRVHASIVPGPFEVVSLRNRPGEPELGTLTVELEGGAP